MLEHALARDLKHGMRAPFSASARKKRVYETPTGHGHLEEVRLALVLDSKTDSSCDSSWIARVLEDGIEHVRDGRLSFGPGHADDGHALRGQVVRASEQVAKRAVIEGKEWTDEGRGQYPLQNADEDIDKAVHTNGRR